jgi:hypothetical protein
VNEYLEDTWSGPGHLRFFLQRLVPLVLGTALRAVFQFIIRGRILLVTAIGYGVCFVAIPYVVARAPANRISRLRGDSPAH